MDDYDVIEIKQSFAGIMEKHGITSLFGYDPECSEIGWYRGPSYQSFRVVCLLWFGAYLSVDDDGIVRYATNQDNQEDILRDLCKDLRNMFDYYDIEKVRSISKEKTYKIGFDDNQAFVFENVNIVFKEDNTHDQ